MGLESSWQFLGGPGSWSYRIFDAQRRKLNRRLVRRLAKLAPSNGRILEGGCGPAYASSCFGKEPGISLSVGADADVEALRQAKQRDFAQPVIGGDLYRLPFRSETFDLVWNSSTLEHLENKESALQEMRRVAKTGGSIFVGVPYRFGPFGFQPWIRKTLFGRWIGPVFGRKELVRLVQEQGLKAEETFTYFYGCFLGVVARKENGS